MQNPELNCDFFGRQSLSPLVLASGVMGISYSGMARVANAGCGIITTKSFSLQPRKGHEGPVIAEFAGGFMNSMGLSNPGLAEGHGEIAALRNLCTAPVIISLFAANSEDFVSLAQQVQPSLADALELNLSCPNVADEYGIPLAASKEQVTKIISAVKSVTGLPVIAKLSPNTFNVPEIALAAAQAGADALTLVNTLGPGMLIDIHARKPVLLNKFGGVSGSALKPIALKLVYEISRLVSIPIIGTGGISTAEDAIEFFMAGASYIGVGTAVYTRGIPVFDEINQGIVKYLHTQQLSHFHEIKRI